MQRRIQNQVKHLRRSFLRFHLYQISSLIKLQADTCNIIKKENLVQVKQQKVPSEMFD